MDIISAFDPISYREEFYRQLGLTETDRSVSPVCHTYEKPGVGFIKSFGDLSRITAGVGHYMIPESFSMRHSYDCGYLHFGIIYEGITYNIDDGDEKVRAIPSSFVSIERSLYGTSHWKRNQKFKGTEISVELKYLEQSLLPVLGVSLDALDFLSPNRRFHHSNEDLKRILNQTERYIMQNKMTAPLLKAATLEFIALLLLPDTINALHLRSEHFSASVKLGNRKLTITDADYEKITGIGSYLALHANSFPTVFSLSHQFEIPEQKLAVGFRYIYGQTIGDYLTMIRMNQAIELLGSSNIGISEIGERIGYQSHAAFNNMFKKWTGLTPRQFRQHMKGRQR